MQAANEEKADQSSACINRRAADAEIGGEKREEVMYVSDSAISCALPVCAKSKIWRVVTVIICPS